MPCYRCSYYLWRSSSVAGLQINTNKTNVLNLTGLLICINEQDISVDHFVYLISVISSDSDIELISLEALTMFVALSKLWKCNFLKTRTTLPTSRWSCSVLMSFLCCYIEIAHGKWSPLLLKTPSPRQYSSATCHRLLSSFRFSALRFNNRASHLD